MMSLEENNSIISKVDSFSLPSTHSVINNMAKEEPNLNLVIRSKNGTLFRPVWKNKKDNKKKKKQHLLKRYKLTSINYQKDEFGINRVTSPCLGLDHFKYFIFSENCVPLSSDM